MEKEKLAHILNGLQKKKQNWQNLPLSKKIFYLNDCQKCLKEEAHSWVQRGVRAKGLAENSNGIGQEWLTGPVIIMRLLRLFKNALKQKGTPKVPNKQTHSHRILVLPENKYESWLWRYFKAEVWLRKKFAVTQGELYRIPKKHPPAVSLILGAGNVSSITISDVLHKLFLEGQVCFIKLSPVNDYLLDSFNRVFASLIADGYVFFTRGDGNLGAWLCHHPAVDEIHITGSHHTHDAIVWGDPKLPQTVERKKNNAPLLNKPITSELGCVTPAILVPGDWTQKELQYHVTQIASAIENNASFNCNAVKVLVTSRHWPQRELFLNLLRAELKKMPPRLAYYPGAQERYQKFLTSYAQCEVLGEEKKGCIPWTLIPNIPPHKEEYALNNEAFCGVLAEVALDAADTPTFLNQAVSLCNEHIWGTLSCSLIIDPRTQKKFQSELDRSLESLRYGAIGVNCWAGISYALGSTTWGAYPGHTLQDIQSGIGQVHNTFLFDHPEKSILYAPFRAQPTPVWFYTNPKTERVAKNLFAFEYEPSFTNFLKVMTAALLP